MWKFLIGAAVGGGAVYLLWRRQDRAAQQSYNLQTQTLHSPSVVPGDSVKRAPGDYRVS